MGMYSKFILAEPADIMVDLVGNELLLENGIIFDKPCSLSELGNNLDGLKIYGYFDAAIMDEWIEIIEEIHKQNPLLTEFKLHFWYEEDIM